MLPCVGNELNMIVMLPDEDVELKMVGKEIREIHRVDEAGQDA